MAMNLLVGLFCFALCIFGSLGHMSMQFPYPRDTLNGASYAVWQQNEPMWSVHPTVCHGLDEETDVPSGNEYSAGEFVEIDIYGSASHDGGHCAFWWTTDESSTWYKIIDVKDCTILDEFYVMMPYTMDTACETKCTFAFTWVPVSSGACEIYMNCAEISVSGVTGLSSTDTAITINFEDLLDSDTTCERVSDTTHWTDTLGTVKDEYTEDDANGGATTVDDATDDDVVTADETDITDDIEDDTDALCVNEDADNIDGDIQDDGTCGDGCTGTNCRCDDGQCCSSAGYCGPEVAYYDDDTETYYYYNYDSDDTYYSNETVAISAYCDNNQGDWRLVECEDDNNTSTGNGLKGTTLIGYVAAIFVCLWKAM